ncbi:Regulator of nonsense transcripts 1-like protein [Lasiodiplodia hormozganensis]|uniref:Regulator of nonsense transcripts 1-like protein n=1 Tax=Lasiodiplodia hormozganensis TaxID=869390 RepID=A0AA39YCD5_9PEZI|nr:Regulator of nonsense transcripts 1-like protein [Lasiodiplodia hormozganensis]
MFESVRTATNRLQLWIGPPGTGKTHTLAHIAAATVKVGKKFLLVAPSNQAANEATRKIVNTFQKLGITAPVIRFESTSLALKKVDSDLKQTKRQMLAEAEAGYRIEGDQLAIPGAWPIEDHAEGSEGLFAALINSLKSWWTSPESGRENVHGSQVDDGDPINPDMQLALDIAVNQVRDEAFTIGRDKRIDEDLRSHTISSKIKRALREGHVDEELAMLYADYLTGFDGDEDDARSKAFSASIRKLHSSLLGEAEVVVSVLSVCGEVGKAGSFLPEVVCIDEAGQAIEAECLIAISNFPNAKLFALCGDPSQLPPPTVSTETGLPFARQLDKGQVVSLDNDKIKVINMIDEGDEKDPKAGNNEFAEQMRLSLLDRLSNDLEFPTTRLRQQRRAVPEICHLWSRNIYQGLVENAPGTDVADRPKAQAFQDFTHTEFGIRKSKILIDVYNGQRLKEGTSSINKEFTEYTFQLVQKLLAAGFDAKDILIVTPYAAQKRQYMGALRYMSDKEVAWAVTAYGELRVTTVDAIQGGEAVIVIVDLVSAGEQASPFVQDYRRLNVAVSRARDGLIIVGDSDSMNQETVKDATVPNAKTKKVKKLTKKDFYTSIFLQAQKEEWVFKTEAPEKAGELWLANYTEVATNTANEDWRNATGDSSTTGAWDANTPTAENAGDSAVLGW